MSNRTDVKSKLVKLGAGVLADLIIQSLTPAGALSEWDSETIEYVLSPYTQPLTQLGIPWIGDRGEDAWAFWAEIADDIGVYTDYPPNG